jgi:hypothetical protein
MTAAVTAESTTFSTLSSLLSTERTSQTISSTSSAAARSTSASTSGGTAAATTGGVLHKPQKCSPYVICTLQGDYIYPHYFGFWEQSLYGVTDLMVATVNVNKATSYDATIFTTLPNQQLNGLACDFYQSSLMWDVAADYCSGYNQFLQPISAESEFISDAMFCVTNANLLTTSANPIQIFYSHQVGNTWQIVRIQNSSQTTDYREKPIVTLPVGSGGVVELTRFRVHTLTQKYMNLACSLTYTSALEFLTHNYTSSNMDPWNAVGVVCIHNADATDTANHNYFQLVDAGNHYNLTVTAQAATSGGVAGQQLVLASLQKNFGNPEETGFFGHSLQVLAVGAMCAFRGRFVMTCNDCRL